MIWVVASPLVANSTTTVYLVYSSNNTNAYLSPLIVVGNGPIRSILNLWNGAIAGTLLVIPEVLVLLPLPVMQMVQSPERPGWPKRACNSVGST